MAKRLRAHSTRLILDWPPLGAYIAPTCYSSSLTAIINPIKGPRAIRKSTSSTVLLATSFFFPPFFFSLLFFSFLFFFFLFFALPFPLCSFLSHRFLLLFADSVTRNSGIAIARSGTGSFTWVMSNPFRFDVTNGYSCLIAIKCDCSLINSDAKGHWGVIKCNKVTNVISLCIQI